MLLWIKIGDMDFEFECLNFKLSNKENKIVQLEFIVTVSRLGLKVLQAVLEQFHSGQFLISRSRFTIEDINLLWLISPEILFRQI